MNNSWNHLPLSSSPLALTVYALKVDMVLQRGAKFWTILWIIVHSLAFSSMFGPLVPRVDTVSSPRCAVAPIHNHYHHHWVHIICSANCHLPVYHGLPLSWERASKASSNWFWKVKKWGWMWWQCWQLLILDSTFDKVPADWIFWHVDTRALL